ncbi:MAG: hypothetical protein SF028_06130 [Candidatus Sumerlaeia bacterium]|nr:hypothetical protein [Candidatus Sumerlaeia bacterium]
MRNTLRTSRAVTLTELLVAMVISVIFVGSVVMVFTLTLDASDETRRSSDAHNRARAAAEAITQDLKFLQVDPLLGITADTLVLVDQPLAYGDLVDNDRDGFLDEETVDGADDEPTTDWVDQHQVVNFRTERSAYVGFPDLGDLGVDDDTVFSRDQVAFLRTLGPSAIPGVPIRERVAYRIDTFDGEDNVLVREVTTFDPSVSPDVTVLEPVVFDVVSLDILAWNSNTDGFVPVQPYWLTAWDSSAFPFGTRPLNAPLGVPPFAYPTSFFVRVVVSAEKVPLAEIGPWFLQNRPLKTETAQTVVNVESVLGSAEYAVYVRDP